MTKSGNERAWVVAADSTVGEALAGGLEDAGLEAIRLAEGSGVDPASRAAMRSAFKDALGQGGAPDLVVMALIGSDMLDQADVGSLDSEGWNRIAQQPPTNLMRCLQALLDEIGDARLSIVVLGPSLGHVGAPGHVALSTALEAQRGIVKSAARQLGERGITVNWVSVGPRAYSGKLDHDGIPHGPEMGGEKLALGHTADLRTEVAAAVSLLASKRAAAITGVTMNLDGGEWMLP